MPSVIFRSRTETIWAYQLQSGGGSLPRRSSGTDAAVGLWCLMCPAQSMALLQLAYFSSLTEPRVISKQHLNTEASHLWLPSPDLIYFLFSLHLYFTVNVLKCTVREYFTSSFIFSCKFIKWFLDILMHARKKNCIYIPIRYNIMTTCLTLWRFPLCSQTSSELSSSVVSGTRVFYPGSTGSCMLGGGRGLGPHWIRPAPACLTVAQSEWDLGNLEARSTPWALYCVPRAVPEQCLLCVRAHCPAGGPLLCLNGWFVASGIHMNASTLGFLAEHCIVMRWSMLFTSPASGHNIMPDRYIYMTDNLHQLNCFLI